MLLRSLTRLTLFLLPPLPQHPQSHRTLSPLVWSFPCTAPGPRESTSLRAPAGATAHPRPPGAGAPAHPTPPSNGIPRPRARPRRSSSPTHRPPRRRRGSRRGFSRPAAPFPQPSERGVGAPLPPARQIVCSSASFQFSDPFDSPSLRPRVARCGGPAPPPGPGLFTHSSSILSRRDLPLGRLRTAAPPPRRGPAPRLLPARAHCVARDRWSGRLGILLRTSAVWRQYPKLGSPRWCNPIPTVSKAALSGDRKGSWETSRSH